MKITIQPVRTLRAHWYPCSFDKAMAYELWTTGPKAKRLRRVNTLAEAKHTAALLDASRQRLRLGEHGRLGEHHAGKRWNDVVSTVAGRRSQ